MCAQTHGEALAATRLIPHMLKVVVAGEWRVPAGQGGTAGRLSAQLCRRSGNLDMLPVSYQSYDLKC